MTLDTNVQVAGDLSHATGQRVFDAALRAILRAANREDEFDTTITKFRAKGSSYDWSDDWKYETDTWQTKVGQGLPGIVQVTNDGDCFNVSWDTAYGYSDEDGNDCTQLHVLAMIELESLLDSDLTMTMWNNEYSGEWHDIGPKGMLDQTDNIAEFLNGGDDAKKWFSEVVLPHFAKQL